MLYYKDMMLQRYNIKILRRENTTMKHILVTIPFQDEHKAYLENIAENCQISYKPSADITVEDVKNVEILIGNVKPSVVKEAEKLAWIQLNTAGADPYCKPGIIRPGTFLTCAVGAYGLSVSEYMVTMSLMLARKMDLYAKNQQNCRWNTEGAVSSIWNSVTLVVGLGDIGGEYARRMKALGSYVIGVRRTVKEKPEYLDELHTTDELDELLSKADFIALALPSTAETIHMISERRLKMMKNTAYLINAGRGDAVDSDALNRALREGRLGGCALDVTEPEPLPENHPLWTAPRTIITPHVAGKFFLAETVNRIVRIAGENLRLYLAGEGERMINQINPKTGERKPL